MAFNKVTYKGTTIIDLTEDTVTPGTLAKGVIAHDAHGEIIIGESNLGPVAYQVEGVDNLPNDAADGSMALVTNFEKGWVKKEFPSLTLGIGTSVWSDGEHTYYSSGSDQFVFDGEDWIPKYWFGLEYPDGYFIWTCGEDVYYSQYGEQYKLDKENDRWDPIEWIGVNYLERTQVWTAGNKAYISQGAYHYELTDNYTWVEKTWVGITEGFHTRNIWTDGVNTYCTTTDVLSGSYDIEQTMNRTYVLIDGSWIRQDLQGMRIGDAGKKVWTYDGDVYYNDNMWLGSMQMNVSYILIDNAWVSKTWSGYIPNSGQNIWKHAGNVYCTENGYTYILDDVQNTLFYLRKNGEWVNKGMVQV